MLFRCSWGDPPTVRNNHVTNAGFVFVLCEACAGGIVRGNSNIVSLASLGLLAVGAPGFAATFCVDPTGAGGCRTTIQAAVDAAGPGDLVRVSPGVYFESVVVPPGKDGLRIAGVDRDGTIVDASPYFDRGISGDDPAFQIQSANVVLRMLTIRNGATGVQVEGAGAVLEFLSFRGADRAVVITGPRAEVRRSSFFACQDCVILEADDAVVNDNTFDGGTINVSLEQFTNTRRPVVTPRACWPMPARRVPSTPCALERSRVARAGLVIAPPNDFRGNCIETFGHGVRISDNHVSRCADSGFYVRGPSNVLENNTVTQSAGDGITVDGREPTAARDTQLLGNVANNAAQGIAIINGALRTTVTGNTALGNRVDFCDEGVQTVESGNTFGTRGPCAVRH